MFTESSVKEFLEEKLELKEWKSLLDQSKLKFFLEFTRKFKLRIYYQNFSYVKEPFQTPTRESSIYDVTKTVGGACIQMNYCFQALLEFLGYDSFLASAPHNAISHEHNHMVVITRIEQSPGNVRLFMVDVGLPWPIPEPVDLNALPNVTTAGGFKLMYRYNVNNKLYERVIVGGDPVKAQGPFEKDDDEVVDITFDLKPRTFDDFQNAMCITFTQPESTFFLNTSFAFRFSKLENSQDFEYIVCFARSIIVGNPSSRKAYTYNDYTEMIPDIVKHFPNFVTSDVEAAFKKYQNRFLEKGE